jgi:hypothetical protein
LWRKPGRKLKARQVSTQIGVPYPEHNMVLKGRNDQRDLLIGGSGIAEQIGKPNALSVGIDSLQAVNGMLRDCVALIACNNNDQQIILHAWLP